MKVSDAKAAEFIKAAEEAGAQDVARRRTSPLLRPSTLQTRTLDNIVISAYIIGLYDGATAMQRVCEQEEI